MSNKPKILILTDWFTPGYKAGGPITSLSNLTSLISGEIGIDVVTSDRDFGDKSPYDDIQFNQWINTDFGRILYISKNANAYKEIKNILKKNNYNAVYLNNMWSWRFTLIPLIYNYKKRKTKVIIAPRGMLHDTALAIKPFKKRIFLTLGKIIGLYKSVVFHTSSEEEINYIQRQFFKNKIVYISNVPSSIKNLNPTFKYSNQINLLFIGRIHKIKNLLFSLETLKFTKGNIELKIIGFLEDFDYFDQCLNCIDALPSNILVTYLNDMPPPEITQYLEWCHFMILPTQGENFGHAIFESFAHGRPVIISDQTPWRGLEKQFAGFDIPLDEPEEWDRVIEKCVSMEQKEYNLWCEGALKLAQNFFRNQDFKSKYLNLFK